MRTEKEFESKETHAAAIRVRISPEVIVVNQDKDTLVISYDVLANVINYLQAGLIAKLQENVRLAQAKLDIMTSEPPL